MSKKEKTHIRFHRYLGVNAPGSYVYEIGFSKSLETTTRMQAMTRGLDKFDKWAGFYKWLHWKVTFPLHRLLKAGWTKRLARYTYIRF